ncbi:MAG: hypothetical protein ACLQMO_13110 [Acidobacteriaceae bacterium]
MRGLKALVITAALIVPLAMLPSAKAQVSITIGGPPPVCPYGYYGYAPYACAPYGYYGPGYFYNGIFLGVGPWAYWGYRHGWGGHRFNSGHGGRYHGRPTYHGRPGPPHHGGGRPGGGGRPSGGGGGRPPSSGGNHGGHSDSGRH